MCIKYLLQRFMLFFISRSGSTIRIWYWRKQGIKIGKDCLINNVIFSTEPYLIEIGNHVAIAAGTSFITHDGAMWCFRDELKNGDIFGGIKIGDNVFVGINCTILPNTNIGNNCIVGAGSVVRGDFPDNSVIIGNPAKAVMSTSIQKLLYLNNPNFLEIRDMPLSRKKKILMKHFGME